RVRCANATQCRYCCKSPKLPVDNFPAESQSDRRAPIRVASNTLPRSPTSFPSDDEVPHIAPIARRIFGHQCKKTLATISATSRHSDRGYEWLDAPGGSLAFTTSSLRREPRITTTPSLDCGQRSNR